MMVLRRLLANIIDIVVFFAVLVGAFLIVFPPIAESFEAGSLVPLLAAAGLIALAVAAYGFAQYPFLKINQTIGKAFFGLMIVSTNKDRPLTVSIIIQREVFAKAMPFYLLCLPVFFGKTGQHEVATETAVVKK